MKKLLILLCLFNIFLAGCAAAPFVLTPVVTGVVMWSEGEAHKYYNEEVGTIYRSTKKSLRELDLKITEEKATGNGGYYLVAGDKDRFTINIRQVKPHISEVSIRINFMGDKPYAELVYTQIDLNTNTIEFDDEGRPAKNKFLKRLDQ